MLTTPANDNTQPFEIVYRLAGQQHVRTVWAEFMADLTPQCMAIEMIGGSILGVHEVATVRSA